MDDKNEDLVSGMLFFQYTELSQVILNQIVTGYHRLIWNEKKKLNPDETIIAEWEMEKEKVLDVLFHSENFISIDRMKEIIDHYTPIMKKLV